MKVTVKKTFQDVITGSHHYPGEVIDVTDAKRTDAMVKMDLVEVAETKATRKTSRKLDD